MTLKRRIEAMTAGLHLRLLSEWDAAYRPIQDTLRAAPADELAAIYRQDVALHGWAWIGARSEDHARELCGGAFGILPGDDELILQATARIPADVQSRCVAARRACLAAGVVEVREDARDIERARAK